MLFRSHIETAFGVDPIEIGVESDEVAADRAKAQEIYRQITADAAKNKPERERIMRDLQAKIFAIAPGIGGTRFKGPGGAFNEMDKYIRGDS